MVAVCALLWWWLTRAAPRRGARTTYTLGDAQPPTATASTAWGSRWRRWFERAPDVEVSAVAPRAVRPGQSFRVQVLLAARTAMADHLARVAAGAVDAQTVPPRSLFAPLGRHVSVEFTLECSQPCTVAPTHLSVVWTGTPVAIGFQVNTAAALAGDRLLIDVNVFVDRVCVGHLPIDLSVGEGEAVRTAPTAPTRLQRPERVFMSYNHQDLAQVIQVARALRRFGIEAFMDRLSIEGGDEWEPRLNYELQRCDVFMLFWSSSAAGSDWVLRETKRALALNRGSARRVPRIVTHVLGPPPPAQPPAGLEALHFNDPVYAQWQATMSAPSQS